MTTQLEVLNEFIEEGGVLFEHIFESSVVDAYFHEDEYFSAAIDKYCEMLEDDEIDENFEEQLSTIIAPYFVATTPFYENLIIEKLGLKAQMAVQKGKAKVASVQAARSKRSKATGKDAAKIAKMEKSGSKTAQKIADKFASGKLPKSGKSLRGSLRQGGKKLMKGIREKYGKKYVRGMLKAAGKKALSVAKATPGAVWKGVKATPGAIKKGGLAAPGVAMKGGLAAGAAASKGAKAVGRAGAATGRGVARGAKAVYKSPGKAYKAVAAGVANVKLRRNVKKMSKAAEAAMASA